MKIFIDTANLNEIKEVSSWGFIDGVTTNPSLIAKEGKDLVAVIKEITSLINGPISAEVAEADANTMYNEALTYAKIHPNIVIKLPMTLDGLKTTKMLT
jgi:transaldolase